MTASPRLPTARPPRAALLALLALSSWPAPACAQRTPPARPAPAVAAARPVDWDALRDEAVGTLQAYLRINTTNPPGNELAAARFLATVLEREGIETRILDTTELGAGRANLYARLRGTGAKRAIALVHHMDVVAADPRYWRVDPFAGVVQEGFVYGRGAIDMKGEAIAHLYAMIALKRSGVPLSRDVVFIANADEELGSTGGIVFVERHADLLQDVEFLLTEGGDNAPAGAAFLLFGVGVAEKRTFWQRLTVKGVPSHASRPTPDNPVPRLVAAVDRLARLETPLHVTPGVAKYFRDIAPRYEGDQRRWLADVAAAVADPRARAWLTADVYWNAILRNTVTPTVLTGSPKTNVIPAEASADIDIRLLPDQDPAVVLAELQRAVNDTQVAWRTLLAPKTPLENPTDTPLFRAIERAARERSPRAVVTTPMMTGATDRPTYRRLGIVTYGIDPFQLEEGERQRGMHGNDERVSIANVGFGVRFVYDVLRYSM